MKYRMLLESALLFAIMIACRLFDIDPTYILVFWWLDEIMTDAQKAKKERKP